MPSVSSVKSAQICVLLAFSCIVLANQETEFTPAEKRDLAKFHELVDGFLYMQSWHRDSYLISWIRASNGDVNRAKQKLVSSLNWRRQNGIDTILTEKNMIKMEKLFPISLKGVDKEGRPILTLHFATWDIRKLMLAGKGADLTRYLDYLFERIAHRIHELQNTTGTDVSQMNLLVDMSGYSLRQHACLACLTFYFDLITHYELHYPQKAKRIILINTSRVFDNLLQLLLPIMTPYVQKSLYIHGHDKQEWSTALAKIIPLDQLPPKYGGTMVI